MKLFLTPAFVAVAVIGTAQVITDTTKAPENWFNLDPYQNNVNGVSTERAYAELLKDKKSTTVVVGVIDSGVDYNHEDLKDVMWTNPGEVAGNGIDDDKNGYTDDIHGWNFIGGKDGRNVDKDNLELTRLYRDYKKKYEGKDEKTISSGEKKDFEFYQKLKADYEKELNEAQQQLTQINYVDQIFTALNLEVKDQLKVDTVRLAQLDQYKTEDKKQQALLAYAKVILTAQPEMTLDDVLKQVDEGQEHYENSIKYNLNLEYDPRGIVGDNYTIADEKYYGNNDCNGPNSLHGTHVAGIIGADRTNNIGMKGVADNVKIMAIRAVPDGDERDKDVANAIIYAVDNGAKVINMSFGKMYPFNKAVVDKAVKYAESKDVLMVHAAGNSSLDIDKEVHYPCKKYANGKNANNWIDVGALSWKKGVKLPARFSNYGKKTVDVFAPGVDIYSTKNGGGYLNESGTSMASPVTAGVAAVIRSYYPNLTAKQVKKIIEKSVDKDYKKQKVNKPGDKIEVKFGDLSTTGGIVNLYNAIKMAEKMSK